MLMPSIFGESLLDDFLGFPFSGYDRTGFGNGGYMNTDIKETDTGYELTMNMPGAKKEDVKAELKDGYLTVQVTTSRSSDEKDKDSRSHPKRRFFHRRHYTRPFPDHNKHLYYSAPAAEKSTGKP